jgi:hypothetical protein
MIQLIDLAKLVESLVIADGRFYLTQPRLFGLVCFRLRDAPDELNKKLVDSLNESGEMYSKLTVLAAALSLLSMSNKFFFFFSSVINSVVANTTIIRIALGSVTSDEVHVRKAWDSIQKQTTKLLM